MTLNTLPDGTTIESVVSDTYAGPDGKPGCQRTAKNAHWLRINGGLWQISPFRTGLRLMEAIELSESEADFHSLIEAAL